MRAEIISIGTEIMLGEITDTNASFIAAQLPQYGIDLLYVSQVGDNPGRMRELVERAWERSEISFLTGGLGPTEDDITREMVAAALGEEMSIDPAQERVLRERMERGGRRMPERNIKQAMVIPSARALPNPRGTAPGWWVERDGPSGSKRVIAVMPGPPAEMNRMWEHEVAPELERRAQSVLVSRTLKTTGLGESAVDEMLSPLLSGANPSVGIYHRADGVHARISAKAATREQAWRLIRPVEEEARRILGPSIWGEDDESLTGAVGRTLHEGRLTLAVMESATGGAIGDAITNFEGRLRVLPRQPGRLRHPGEDRPGRAGGGDHDAGRALAADGGGRWRRWRASVWARTSASASPASPASPASSATRRSRASRRGRCTSRSTTARAWSTRCRATTRGGRRRSVARCSRR